MTSEMKDKRRQIAEIRVQRPLLTFRIQILSLEKSTGPGQVHTDEFRAIRFRCRPRRVNRLGCNGFVPMLPPSQASSVTEANSLRP